MERVIEAMSPLSETIAIKLLLSLSFFAGAAMLTDDEQWKVIGACTLGGGLGSVVGVAVTATREQFVPQVMVIRWAVNLCFALCFGPLIAIQIAPYVYPTLDPADQRIGPILCMASAGIAGLLGVIALQAFIPLLKRKFTKRYFPDETIDEK